MYKIKRANGDNKYKILLKNGTSNDKIKYELMQGIHRPERINQNESDIFGEDFLRYFVGDPFDVFYEPNENKNPYIVDNDILFYRGIGKKGYYLTLTKEKEKINDAYDDQMIRGLGSESVFFIPSMKSFDNLDELDEIFINYIVYLKQGYFPDCFWSETDYFNEADELLDILRKNKNKLWDKLTLKYPILLKPEYNLTALYNSINFTYNYHEEIIYYTRIKYKAHPNRTDKKNLSMFPAE